jgi:hypothetical protein
MTDASTASPPPIPPERELAAMARQIATTAVLAWRLAAASTEGARRCFVEISAATDYAHGTSAQSSSTAIQTMAPELHRRLDSMLKSASEESLDDGMENSITRSLPDLVSRQFDGIVPALIAVLESRRTSPVVAAEILKELGRLRDAASHGARLWILEYALRSTSPITRDGAGLGLARLGDPDALPFVQRAIDEEGVHETRSDLLLVAEELTHLLDHGAAASDAQ